MNDYTLPLYTKETSFGGSKFRYDLFKTSMERNDSIIEGYGISINEIADEKHSTAFLCDVCESFGKALAITEKLCENTVSPLHASELLFLLE